MVTLLCSDALAKLGVSPERIALIERIISELPIRGQIGVSLIESAEMQRLNREHRDKDATTDVLSFHYRDPSEMTDDQEVIGDIVLDETYIRGHLKALGHSLLREIEILVIHGTLHIAGYDHESDEEYRDMWAVEEDMRKKLDAR